MRTRHAQKSRKLINCKTRTRRTRKQTRATRTQLRGGDYPPGSAPPLEPEELAFLESIPVLDASVPLPDEVRGQNPKQILMYFYNKGFPLPISFYRKFIREDGYDSLEPVSSPIIRLAKEIVSDFDLSDFELLDSDGFNGVINRNSVKMREYKCIWIRSKPEESKSVDSLLLMVGNRDAYVIGGRNSSSISITQSKGEPIVGSDYPINFEISDEGINIGNINKSSIVGHETGKQNMLIALAISKFMNPEGKANVTIYDSASIPCADPDGKNNNELPLSYYRFLTKEKAEPSWYNSFGFRSKYEVDLDRMADYQRKLQSLSMTDIADYFDKLIQVMNESTTYFVIQGVALRLTDQLLALVDRMTHFVKTIRESPCTLKDFFTKKENCIFFELIPRRWPLYIKDYEPLIRNSIPIAFIYNEPDSNAPTSRVYPLAKEFRYVVTHIGTNRIIKGSEYKNNNNSKSAVSRTNTKELPAYSS